MWDDEHFDDFLTQDLEAGYRPVLRHERTVGLHHGLREHPRDPDLDPIGRGVEVLADVGH